MGRAARGGDRCASVDEVLASRATEQVQRAVERSAELVAGVERLHAALVRRDEQAIRRAVMEVQSARRASEVVLLDALEVSDRVVDVLDV